MKFAPILVVYIWQHFLVGISMTTPNSDERILGLEPALSTKHSNKLRPLSPSRTYPRYNELSEKERKERIDRGMARMMQLVIFLSHLDGYFTDKVKTLTKTFNQAIEYEDEDPQETYYYDRRRQTHPRISTTITSR